MTLDEEIEIAGAATSQELANEAIRRGCHFYSAYVEGKDNPSLNALSNEVIGTALLRGKRDIDAFEFIRVGGMLLSHQENNHDTMRAAALKFNVGGRLRHIASLAAQYDNPKWKYLKDNLPDDEEMDFLPGISRFTIETYKPGSKPGKWQFVRIWLKP